MLVEKIRLVSSYLLSLQHHNELRIYNMKIFVLGLMIFSGVLTTQAGEYTFVTFEMTDGTKASVPVSSLTMTISGNTLKAGSQTFVLANLSKMYFSDTNESTAIEEVTTATLDEAAEIYDLRGNKVRKDQMKRGVYVVKTKNKTYKMIVK